MRSLLAILLILASAVSVTAEERTWLGKSRLFTNDKLGDGQDRWRTGSYSLSFIRGTGWNGSAPSEFGALVEYRVRSEIIAPANLMNPAAIPPDRRYVGAISLGAVTHMQTGSTDVSLGLDLVVTGPQTGLGAFQSWAHNALGMGTPTVLGSQIGNAVYPTFSAEIARDFQVSADGARRISFRPFLETQVGVETYARIGGDVTFGNAGLGDFQVRDNPTGHRSIAIKGDRPRGTSFLLGGDVAWVQSSQYLPASSGYSVEVPRVRMRAGVYHEAKTASLFYGLTWLGKEFVNQPEGQVVGSFSVRMKF